MISRRDRFSARRIASHERYWVSERPERLESEKEELFEPDCKFFKESVEKTSQIWTLTRRALGAHVMRQHLQPAPEAI